MRTCRAALLHEFNAPLIVHDDLQVDDPKHGEVLVKLRNSADLPGVLSTHKLTLLSRFGGEGGRFDPGFHYCGGLHPEGGYAPLLRSLGLGLLLECFGGLTLGG